VNENGIRKNLIIIGSKLKIRNMEKSSP